MGSDNAQGWRAYSPLASDEERRIPPKEIVEQHANREPIATVEIRIFDWAPGHAELRFGCTTEVPRDVQQWHDQLVDAAIRELRRTQRTTSDDGQ